MSVPALLIDGPEAAPLTVVLAHGAGAPMDSPFMAHVARGLGGLGWRVARFEFPYMARRREDGRKRGPDPQRKLLATWRAVIDELGGPDRLVIGGKSMGGRMASLIATEVPAAGLLVFGYPFHPPGKADRPRVAHLAELQCPGLVLQGERDPFGRPDEVVGYSLPGALRVVWVPDGDHSFVPRKRSERTEAENLEWAVECADDFLRHVAA